MTQYINKDDLVAEIESKKKYAQTLGDNAINGSMQQFYDGMKQGCVDILSFLDTLVVKEVDLDNFIKEEFDKYSGVDGYGQLSVSYNEAEFYSMTKRLIKAQKGEEV